MLRFSIGGQVIFRRSVHHPGTKPDPFLERLRRGFGTASDSALRNQI
jgi:hypothetical protein